MIPLLDLRAQYRTIAEELEAAVLLTMRSCNYVLGEAVDRFEDDFARFCGTRHAVACNTGTSALHLALLGAGIGAGDEVITVSATFVATVAAIRYAGAVPVMVDVDPVTWTMDPMRVEQAITPRTKAILPVHLHGRLADMDALCAIADRHGLALIEDAAQAHGAMRGGRRAGSFGLAGCFSFYPGKNLGACGEGGALVTDDAELAARVRCLRDWGQEGRYNHVREGFNLRMDGIQGAALGVKLRHATAWNDARRRVANLYGAGLDPAIRRAAGPFGADHVAHVYAILADDRPGARDALQAGLTLSGIGTGIHYPKPVHLQPAYAALGQGPGSLPVSEAIARRTLSLPLYPELGDDQIARVIAAVNALAAGSQEEKVA